MASSDSLGTASCATFSCRFCCGTHCYLLRLQPELELGSKETAQRGASGAYYFTGAAAPQALALSRTFLFSAAV